MRALLLLMVVSLGVLPSAMALNCTRFTGDHYVLCGIITPLPMSEEYKQELMRPDLYGTVEPNTQPLQLRLPLPPQVSLTFMDLYQSHLVFVSKLAMIVLAAYAFYAIITKSSFFRKWLTADF